METGNSGDICRTLRVGCCGCEMPLDPVFRLLRLRMPSRGRWVATGDGDDQALLPEYAVDSPGVPGITSMQSEADDDPPDTVVFAAFLVFPQTLMELLQELTVRTSDKLFEEYLDKIYTSSKQIPLL